MASLESLLDALVCLVMSLSLSSYQSPIRSVYPSITVFGPLSCEMAVSSKCTCQGRFPRSLRQHCAIYRTAVSISFLWRSWQLVVCPPSTLRVRLVLVGPGKISDRRFLYDSVCNSFHREQTQPRMTNWDCLSSSIVSVCFCIDSESKSVGRSRLYLFRELDKIDTTEQVV